MTEWLYQDITGGILHASRLLCSRLGERRQGMTESQISNALQQTLQELGYQVEAEVVIPCAYEGRRVGVHRVDLVVEGVVVVELKTTQQLTSRDYAQLRAYLIDGGWAVGLLLNFGGDDFESKRLYEARNDPAVKEANRVLRSC